MGQSCFLSTLLTWSRRRWAVALAVGLGTVLALGVPTAVIANPVFGRTIAPTSWAMNVLIATGILAGLLTATYVRNDGPVLRSSSVPESVADQRTARRGMFGGLLAYLAIGCPVCNKVVLIALGSTGAVRIFAPVQPYLAAAGLVALAWALVVRLRGEMTCSLGNGPAQATPVGEMVVAGEPNGSSSDS
ncbi:MAG TPA: hypothetical protein VES02_08480 [Dermatophilaceae bacterium]|nr:hypothetical protein [Dermatophilaceae bacterium]